MFLVFYVFGENGDFSGFWEYINEFSIFWYLNWGNEERLMINILSINYILRYFYFLLGNRNIFICVVGFRLGIFS